MPNLKNKKVIKDQQGQRKYPGRVTEIQGNTMATTGYGDIPLYVVPNVGNPMVVPANSGNRVFPGASSFTEYPIAKNGGWLEKYQDGGDFNDYKRPGPVEDRSTGMTGMMKSKIATEAHYGNPSALRMVSPNPNKYTFTGKELDWKGNQALPEGYTGTHFMGSYGDQARPGLQEVNGKMQYFQNPPYNSKENFNFSRPEDAEHFANYYKEVAPMMRNYDEYKNGGWLEKYGDGGETDPPVNLRSASTQLASPVSTQAPEVPLNKTGWDWVKQKYENRQPSEWNMLMMDKSGSYVDSGVDPFSLMLTAPQQVIKAGVKGGKALLDASKSNKIKQVIHEDELIDIKNLKKSFKEAQELKNKDVNTVKIYKNIKSGENWKYPNINITKEQYNSAKNNLKIGPYTAISFAKNNPDKIIIPSKSDNLFKNTPSGNAFYQFYGEGPISNHTIYTPDIHDYINKYHPYTTSRANLESIDLAKKDALKDVNQYFKENFKDYKIPINDFISLPQNKYGGIVKTSQNKQDNSQWLDKYK